MIKQMIHYNEKEGVFHLCNGIISYVIGLENNKYLTHLYFGSAILDDALTYLNLKKVPSFCPETEGNKNFSRDFMLHEYPSNNQGDYRMPATSFETEDGNTRLEFGYETYKIYKGKNPLMGLPSTYVEEEKEAETLDIILKERHYNILMVLSYTIYENRAVATRNVRCENNGKESVCINKLMSMSFDIDNADFEMLQLSGAWARERNLYRRPLVQGDHSIQSLRGASSHQQNPFIALVSKNANEVQGECYGFNLVYSGNFIAGVEVDQFSHSRVYMGINPFEFRWLLKTLEVFQTPEVVMVYSDAGIGGMSRTYHSLYRERLARGKFRDKARPIIINNWEATYFDFDGKKIEDIAKVGSELGIELMVLDDGWFGKRNNDKTSLGDWVVDRNKLPGGLEALVKKVNDMGMQFGLWFEPEMISEESDLYRAHPDWCLHQSIYEPIKARNQLVLDFSRKEVRDYIVESIGTILETNNIKYVKWDCNRSLTDVGSNSLPRERQKEVAHRHILGVYEVMERLATKFSDVLFESCSGGGARFDPGMIYYMPQIWTSDNTDAVQRMKIQYGTSIVYPISAISAHVSTVPNHQTGRITPFESRGNAAITGAFGYELDLTGLTNEEREIIKKQIVTYKNCRDWIGKGDFYRLLSPFEGNDTAWMIVSEDKTHAFVMYQKILSEPNQHSRRLKLQGLLPVEKYVIQNTEQVLYGNTLMNVGLHVRYEQKDFCSQIWYLKREITN